MTTPVNAALNLAAERFEVNNWELSEFVIKRMLPIVGHHPFPVGEVMLMAAAVSRLRPVLIIEWGTHVGKSALIFYELSKKFSPKTVVHSIDLPDDVFHIEHPKNERGRLVRHIPEIRLYQGDGLEIAGKILREHRNAGEGVLFFLDGDHEYASVSGELARIHADFPRASILVHDTFYQSEPSGYNTGPHRAIKDFMLLKADRYTVMSVDTGLPGMTLLLPRPVPKPYCDI